MALQLTKSGPEFLVCEHYEGPDKPPSYNVIFLTGKGRNIEGKLSIPVYHGKETAEKLGPSILGDRERLTFSIIGDHQTTQGSLILTFNKSESTLSIGHTPGLFVCIPFTASKWAVICHVATDPEGPAKFVDR